MPSKRTSRQPELLITLSRDRRRPMREQLQDELRTAIRDRRLRPGTVLPSTRTLADDLSVSRGVVVEAYEQLAAEGYLVTRAGGATRVAELIRVRQQAAAAMTDERFAFDFHPGEPDLHNFPYDSWQRAIRKAARALNPAQLRYRDPRGAIELREALSSYLARARGVVSTPEQVVVCSGCTQGLSLAGRVLQKRGATRLAVEAPGHPHVRQVVMECGLTPVPIPVDDDGLDVTALQRHSVSGVIVSPAHQNPTGTVLSAHRRQQLLAWAARTGAIVIEDDYDAEYRYDRRAVGALQGLSLRHTWYVGSASKLLAPNLRLGWLIVNGPMLDDIVRTKLHVDAGTPVMEQLAYAHFIDSGELDRHLRRMRRIYASRRLALLRALHAHCPDWDVKGAAAGLHLVAVPTTDRQQRAVLDRAARHSIRLYPLSGYNAGTRGFVFGYAKLTEAQIAAAFTRLFG
ncbi:MAG TPA: PLP-dependent aminotransferase family protein [Vicinamibacterales bacterium]|nr:PLP-dependent aminotransferase family protein [Vicinamibacterales bacterium]